MSEEILSDEESFPESSDSSDSENSDELEELIGALQSYRFEPEQERVGGGEETSETSSDESEDESNMETRRAGHKDWCICGECKKEIREIGIGCWGIISVV